MRVLQGEYENLLLVGSVDGSVVAFDSSRLDVRWVKRISEGSVISMCLVQDGAAALVMTKLGTSLVLDCKTGNELARWHSPAKTDILKMAPLSDARVLLGGSSITVVDSATGAKLGRWTGHPTPVIDIAASQSSAYFCTAATGDRTIAIWSTKTSSSGQLSHKAAVAQISLEQPVAQVSMAVVSATMFHVLAVTLTGDVHVCKCAITDTHGKWKNGIEVVEWASSQSDGIPVVQVAVTNAEANSVQMIVASGSAVRPKFSSISIVAPSDGTKTKILKVADEGTMLVRGTASTKDKNENLEFTVAGANEKTVIRPAAMDMQIGLENGIEPIDIMDEDEDKDSEEEMTFAERISALKGADDVSVSLEKPTSDSAVPPKADSLSVLLSQAIANEDRALLERCLTVRNNKTVSKTIKQLSPADATKLIKLLVHKLQASPRRGEQLAGWVRAILVHHAGFFAGTGSCKDTLTYLYQIIDSRLASYQSLVALKGRLDLVLSTARKAKSESFEDGQFEPLISLGVDDDGQIEIHDATAAVVQSESDISSNDEDEEDYNTDDSDEMDED